MIRALFLSFFYLVSAFLSPIYARWAVDQDLSELVDLRNIDLMIQRDGSYQEVTEFAVTLKKDAARNYYSGYQIRYNAANSKIKIIKAYTQVGGQKFAVDLSKIEDKPLASSADGFDQQNQVMIAFPKLAVGSTVYLKYQLTQTQAAIPNYFSTQISFGTHQKLLKGQLRIKSKLPIHYKVNDPDQVLNISSKNHTPWHYLQVKLKHPVSYMITDEENGYLNNKQLPTVSITSADSWAELGRHLSSQYTAIMNQPLPESFQEIVNAAKQKSQSFEKINTVTSMLASKIQYMGDWGTINGQLIPHNLSQIAKTQLGDCKDFSVSTAAILHRLGYQAHVALIQRGGNYATLLPNHLPGAWIFNHAIVHVTKPNGDSLWIDPTNFLSMAQLIFPDISDRQALILRPGHEAAQMTPKLRSSDQRETYQYSIDLKDKHMMQVTGSVQLAGRAAMSLSGAQLNASVQQIKEWYLSQIMDPEKVINYHVNIGNLTSRVVKDIGVQYHLTARSILTKTNGGNTFKLWPYLPQVFLKFKLDRVSDLWLGHPRQIKAVYTIKHAKVSKTQPLDFEIDSPWVQAKRTVTFNKDTVKITDLVNILKDHVPSHVLQLKKFQNMRQHIESDYVNTAILFE